MYPDPEGSKTILSAKQAIAIAQAANIETAFKDDLRLADIVEKGGRILWCVSSVSKGSQDLVFIDDETGKIVETKRAGIR